MTDIRHLTYKQELTLQTLRSILGLELNCSWADIVASQLHWVTRGLLCAYNPSLLKLSAELIVNARSMVDVEK